MTRQEFHKKAHLYLALGIAFSLPFGLFTPIIISLMVVNWIIEADFRNKFKAIISNKFVFLFGAFFVVHILGMLNTQDTEAGFFDIQVKLSVIVFPILFASRPFDSGQINKLLLSLVVGCITSSLVILSRAVYTYYVYEQNNFFYQAFSYLVHPSYISMYLNVAIAWLLINIVRGKFNSKKIILFLAFLTIVFFSFINVLLASKMGLIIMVLLYIGFLIFSIINKKKYLMGGIGLVILIVSIIASLKLFPEVTGRINRSIAALTSSSSSEADAESTTVRLHIWKAANKVISENLITGVGTGDAKDELIEEYKRRGMTGAVEHDLNAHNEFYQVFVALGLIGFLLLFLNLILPLYFAFKSNEILYVLFLLIIIINFIPESMLETQAGVMFYAFFNSVLCFQNSPNSNKIK